MAGQNRGKRVGLAIMISIGGVIAVALLIVLMVQQETIVIFLSDLVVARGKGFPASAALSLVLQRSLLKLLAVDIPVLGFASLTRNL